MPSIHLRLLKRVTAIELIVRYTINSDAGSILYFDNCLQHKNFHKTLLKMQARQCGHCVSTATAELTPLRSFARWSVVANHIHNSGYVEIVEISTPQHQSSDSSHNVSNNFGKTFFSHCLTSKWGRILELGNHDHRHCGISYIICISCIVSHCGIS